jgi:RNA polymerase sigma-70 factor (ECF subfamily)
MIDKDFERMMEGVGKGNEDAVWELVTTYGESLRRAVRRVLNGKLRSKFDSIDFVQIVWKSFFRMDPAARRCESPEQLTAFLAGMARNKVRAEVRKRLKGPAYNVGREQGLDDSIDAEHLAGGRRHPLPIEIAIARERWNQLLHNQPEHYRKIIRLKLCGHSCAAIGEKLHLHADTVRRFLTKLLLSTAR